MLRQIGGKFILEKYLSDKENRGNEGDVTSL